MSEDQRTGVERMLTAIFQILIAAVLAWLGSQIIENRERLISMESRQQAILSQDQRLERLVEDHEERLRTLE